MRSVSQLVLTVMLVGVAIAAATMLSYIVSNLLITYKPSEQIIAKVGTVDVSLEDICNEVICGSGSSCPCPTTGYRFTVTIQLINLGNTEIRIEPRVHAILGWDYPKIVVLLKGNTGKGIILKCYVYNSYVVMPGEIRTIVGECFVSDDQLESLFGVYRPSFDEIKKNVVFLYMYLGKSLPLIY